MFLILKICFWMVIAFIGMGIVENFWKQTLIAVAVIGVGLCRGRYHCWNKNPRLVSTSCFNS